MRPTRRGGGGVTLFRCKKPCCAPPPAFGAHAMKLLSLGQEDAAFKRFASEVGALVMQAVRQQTSFWAGSTVSVDAHFEFTYPGGGNQKAPSLWVTATSDAPPRSACCRAPMQQRFEPKTPEDAFLLSVSMERCMQCGKSSEPLAHPPSLTRGLPA